MSIATAQMTMRAVLKRGAGTDGYGGPAAGEPLVINPAAACFIYTKTARELSAGGVVAQVEEVRGMFSAGEDIKAGDEIGTVQDRAGTEIIAGPLFVNIVTPRLMGSSVSHLEVTLKRTR